MKCSKAFPSLSPEEQALRFRAPAVTIFVICKGRMSGMPIDPETLPSHNGVDARGINRLIIG